MKVFDLRCAALHRFEGWFASHESFLQQMAQRMVCCPFCGSSEVERMQHPAPALPPHPGSGAEPSQDNAEVLASELIRTLRALSAQAEEVGDGLPDEADKIHVGEALDHHPIKGHASIAEITALQDEGILLQSMHLKPEKLH